MGQKVVQNRLIHGVIHVIHIFGREKGGQNTCFTQTNVLSCLTKNVEVKMKMKKFAERFNFKNKEKTAEIVAKRH